MLKKVIFAITTFFSSYILNVNSSEYVSLKNQECRATPKVINVNTDEPVFYPYSIKVNKCSGSCNNINNPYAKLCIPDTIKNINVKIFNLMQRINGKNMTCKCICRLTAAVGNSRQRWNEGTCRCECKEELINKIVCDKGTFSIQVTENANVIRLVVLDSI